MGRVLFVILVAVGAIATPGIRAKLLPYVQPALDPVYEWSTRSRVSEIARMIHTEKAAGRRVPTPKTFMDFLEQRFPGGGVTDPWGAPYYLKKEKAGLVVGSSGRDGARGTDDDIRMPVPQKGG